METIHYDETEYNNGTIIKLELNHKLYNNRNIIFISLC